MELFTNLYKQDLFDSLGISVVGLGLLLVRILSFLHFAPVFSHKSIPSHFRIGFSMFLTAILNFKLAQQTIPETGFSMIYAIMANIILGFIMGFTANLLFVTVTAAGEMMDAAMGFSSAQMFDPSLGSQTTIMGKFLGMLSIVIFFSIGGPEMLITGLSNSIDSFSIFNPSINFNVDKIIHLCGDIISMGFILVSPIVLTILVNDLVLGLISRASPQINAFQISFTIKPCLGIITWILILPLFFTCVANFFSSASRLF